MYFGCWGVPDTLRLPYWPGSRWTNQKLTFTPRNSRKQLGSSYIRGDLEAYFTSTTRRQKKKSLGYYSIREVNHHGSKSPVLLLHLLVASVPPAWPVSSQRDQAGGSILQRDQCLPAWLACPLLPDEGDTEPHESKSKAMNTDRPVTPELVPQWLELRSKYEERTKDLDKRQEELDKSIVAVENLLAVPLGCCQRWELSQVRIKMCWVVHWRDDALAEICLLKWRL